MKAINCFSSVVYFTTVVQRSATSFLIQSTHQHHDKVTKTTTATTSSSITSVLKKPRKQILEPIYSTKGRNDNRQSVTSSVISNLAVLALKLRLKSHSGVSCDVEASSRALFLASSVGPVTVKGRAWSSPLGLTCRAIEASVSECKLDMNAVVQRQKLILTTPAVGKAMVALDEVDFGNFLTHPLLEKQVPKVAAGKFEFDKKSVVVQEQDGHVIFYGDCGGKRWKCILKRIQSESSRSPTAFIDVSHVEISDTSMRPTTENKNLTTEAAAADQDLEAIGMELTMVMTQFSMIWYLN
jgi:Protein of unknown function (DUF2993).